MFDKTLEISLICKYVQRNILQIYFISVNLEILHKLVCWYESFSHPLEPENVSLLDLCTSRPEGRPALAALCLAIC